jgi:hypothetical protein
MTTHVLQIDKLVGVTKVRVELIRIMMINERCMEMETEIKEKTINNRNIHDIRYENVRCIGSHFDPSCLNCFDLRIVLFNNNMFK